MDLPSNWDYIAWWCSLLHLEWKKTFIQTYHNMGCESIYHQWACYKKKARWYITSSLFNGICSYYRSYHLLETRSKVFIHRSHNVWFDEYDSCLSIEDKHTLGSLILWQDTESHIHNSDLLNLITCELDITSNQFSDTKTITYEIELPLSGNKVGFNLLDDEGF